MINLIKRETFLIPDFQYPAGRPMPFVHDRIPKLWKSDYYLSRSMAEKPEESKVKDTLAKQTRSTIE
jgi:hypothetical protein